MLRNGGVGSVKAALAVGITIGCLLVAGCAPVRSVRMAESSNAEGLVYFLPKRDIVVTLTRGKTKDDPSTLSIGPGDAYADLSQRFVLTVGGTPAASRDTDVKVSAAGLLESSSAKLESKVGLIAAELAKTAVLAKGPIGSSKDADTCQQFTSYTVSIDLNAKQSTQLCNLMITVKSADATVIPDVHLDSVSSKPDVHLDDVSSKKDRAGYYYRQGRPYRVQVCPLATNNKSCNGNDNLAEKIISSPTGAPTQFLPVSKAFFADNTNTAIFNEGTLREYKEVKNSELLGVASIPAGVVAAYFGAASSLFDFMETDATKEAELLNAKLSLELVKARYDACLIAIQNKDEPAKESLGCAGK